MNELTISKFEQAEQLHARIIASGQMAADALLELCRCLKQMKDEKLYEEFGYNDFDEYCVEKAGIKSRMADYYISTYERLGSTVLTENAGLGITKLSLIAGMNPIERTELLESGELEGKSVAEIKEIVAKSKEQGEQISMLEKENGNLKESIEEIEEGYEDQIAEIKENYEDQIADLEKELKELRNAPVEVAVEQMSDEEKEKIRKDIEKEVRKELKSKEEATIQKAVDKAVSEAEKKAVEKGKQEAERELESQIEALKAAATQSKAIAEEAERKLKLADNTAAVVSVYFQSAQDSINALIKYVQNIENEDDRAKYMNACKKLLETAIAATEQ